MEIFTLNQLKLADKKRVGIKAAALGELTSNFNVPNGFVIPAEMFEDFLDETKLREKITDLLHTADLENHDELQKNVNEIQKSIVYAEMPSETKELIIEFYQSLGIEGDEKISHVIDTTKTPLVAVRSSPSVILGASKQHMSFLNIIGEERVIKAVQTCWASLFTAKSVYQKIIKGIGEIGMAVIVQKMLSPKSAGRIFTVSQKSRKEIIIEACLGLGEALSSGIIMADRYMVEKKTNNIIKYEINNQHLKLVTDPETGKTIKIQIEEKNAKNQKITDREIEELAVYAKKIETIFGSPQLIEFGIQNGKIYILESAPLQEEFIPKESAEEILESADETYETKYISNEEKNTMDEKEEEGEQIEEITEQPELEAQEIVSEESYEEEKLEEEKADTERLSSHQLETGGRTNLEKMRGDRASVSERACHPSMTGGVSEHFDKEEELLKEKETTYYQEEAETREREEEIAESEDKREGEMIESEDKRKGEMIESEDKRDEEIPESEDESIKEETSEEDSTLVKKYEEDILKALEKAEEEAEPETSFEIPNIEYSGDEMREEDEQHGEQLSEEGELGEELEEHYASASRKKSSILTQEELTMEEEELLNSLAENFKFDEEENEGGKEKEKEAETYSKEEELPDIYEAEEESKRN